MIIFYDQTYLISRGGAKEQWCALIRPHGEGAASDDETYRQHWPREPSPPLIKAIPLGTMSPTTRVTRACGLRMDGLGSRIENMKTRGKMNKNNTKSKRFRKINFVRNSLRLENAKAIC